jgi:hypothetical protein
VATKSKPDMKVRARLIFTASARAYIGKTFKKEQTTRQGYATREACIAWLQQRLDDLSKRGDDVFLAAKESLLSQKEKEEYRQAIQYLLAAGKSDTFIRDWVLLQRARFDFPRVESGD